LKVTEKFANAANKRPLDELLPLIRRALAMIGITCSFTIVYNVIKPNSSFLVPPVSSPGFRAETDLGWQNLTMIMRGA
jgi:hypothetical protein